MVKYLIALIILLNSLLGYGQINQGLWFTDSIFQSISLNPASVPTGNITVRLPEAQFQISQKGPLYSDIIEINNEGTTTINISNATQQAKDDNFYSTYLNVGSLGIGMRFGKSYISLSHDLRLLGHLSYPKDLVELYANGNAQFIGEEISIGPDFQLSLFNQFAVSYSYGNQNIRAGVRLKYLSGIEDVTVENDRINLFTNEDIYQLEFNNNYLINTSSLLRVNDLSDIAFDYDGIEYFDFFGRNSGLAFDLGAEFKLPDGSVLSASILDLGSLSWKEDITNYSSTGMIIYDGVDILDIVRDSSEILLLDSLYNVLDFEETNNDYTSPLPTKIYVGYTHSLNSALQLSYLYFMQSFRGEQMHALSVAANFSVLQNVQLGASYLMTTNNLLNLGLHGKLKLGPIQVIANTGNIFGLIDPKASHHTSGHLGLNLVF